MHIDWSQVTFQEVMNTEKRLRSVLCEMGVPESRRDTRNLRMLKWLNRNLTASWGDHELHDEARELLTWLLRWEARLDLREMRE